MKRLFLALVFSVFVSGAQGSDIPGSAAGSPELEGSPGLPRVRFWGALGPTMTTTLGYVWSSDTYAGKDYGGVAFGAGLEALLGEERRWVLGYRMLFPWINEASPGARGYGAGRIARVAVLPGFGYAFIPHKLEVMLHAGLSYIAGESSEFDAKIGATPGITLAWQLSAAARGVLYQGIELGAIRIEETRATADLGVGTGFCAAITGAFGGATPDPACTRGIAAAAYVFTLLYKVGGQY
jgi:hypothetical protein